LHDDIRTSRAFSQREVIKISGRYHISSQGPSHESPSYWVNNKEYFIRSNITLKFFSMYFTAPHPAFTSAGVDKLHLYRYT
ncbi:MAG: hypothetical protein MUD15_13185, partial [Desulfobacterota bacterium]|nr:hypothetical protein [Thermodesulfobacteriota bacterium]